MLQYTLVVRKIIHYLYNTETTKKKNINSKQQADALPIHFINTDV